MKTFILLSIAFANFAHSQVCPQRVQDATFTVQEPRLDESSGMAFSKRYPNRLYHINDSGSEPEFFFTDADGNNSQRVPIRLGFFLDTEDMTVGPCLGESSCLVIGDIGDNLRFRPSIQFYFFKESNLTKTNLDHLATAGLDLQPDLVLSVSYPDHSHNSEGFYLDKKGNLTLITKEKNGTTAQIFLLTADQIHVAALEYVKKNAGVSGDNPKFKSVGKLSLKPLLPSSFAAINTEITGAAYNEVSDTVAILTYQGVFEIPMSSLTKQAQTAWIAGTDYVYSPARAGKQQEAISYIPGTSDLLISSEMGKDGLTPLLKLRCEN